MAEGEDNHPRYISPEEVAEQILPSELKEKLKQEYAPDELVYILDEGTDEFVPAKIVRDLGNGERVLVAEVDEANAVLPSVWKDENRGVPLRLVYERSVGEKKAPESAPDLVLPDVGKGMKLTERQKEREKLLREGGYVSPKTEKSKKEKKQKIGRRTERWERPAPVASEEHAPIIEKLGEREIEELKRVFSEYFEVVRGEQGIFAKKTRNYLSAPRVAEKIGEDEFRLGVPKEKLEQAKTVFWEWHKEHLKDAKEVAPRRAAKQEPHREAEEPSDMTFAGKQFSYGQRVRLVEVRNGEVANDTEVVVDDIVLRPSGRGKKQRQLIYTVDRGKYGQKQGELWEHAMREKNIQILLPGEQVEAPADRPAPSTEADIGPNWGGELLAKREEEKKQTIFLPGGLGKYNKDTGQVQLKEKIDKGVETGSRLIDVALPDLGVPWFKKEKDLSKIEMSFTYNHPRPNLYDFTITGANEREKYRGKYTRPDRFFDFRGGESAVRITGPNGFLFQPPSAVGIAGVEENIRAAMQAIARHYEQLPAKVKEKWKQSPETKKASAPTEPSEPVSQETIDIQDGDILSIEENEKIASALQEPIAARPREPDRTPNITEGDLREAARRAKEREDIAALKQDFSARLGVVRNEKAADGFEIFSRKNRNVWLSPGDVVGDIQSGTYHPTFEGIPREQVEMVFQEWLEEEKAKLPKNVAAQKPLDVAPASPPTEPKISFAGFTEAAQKAIEMEEEARRVAAPAAAPTEVRPAPSASSREGMKKKLEAAKERLNRAEEAKKQYESVFSKLGSFLFSSEGRRRAEAEKEYADAFDAYNRIERLTHGAGAEFAKLGISQEELDSIEGFRDLSNGQQLLVLENLKQLTLGRIQEEAGGAFRKETNDAKFLGRVWRGITKQYQIAKLERATAEEINKGGMRVHGEVLTQLVKGTKEMGLDVLETDHGLEIQYASGFERLTAAEAARVKAFNEMATAFSRMPYEWSLDTASGKQRKEYEKLKEQYERAKGDMLRLKVEKSAAAGMKEKEKEATFAVSDIDNRLRLNQFLNTHPDVEKELKAVENPALYVRALKNVITERGIYMGAGFAARTATVSLLGAIGVPIAAGAVGGWVARERAKAGLAEQEKLARKGLKERKSAEDKNIAVAKALTEKIELLVTKIESETDEGKKAKLIGSLRERLRYTEDKIEKGLVNFGKSDERLLNQYALVDTLNSAEALHMALGDGVESANLRNRLDRFLKLKEKNISDAQKKYLWKQTIRGAMFGAAFASAGWAVRHFLFSDAPESALQAEENAHGKVTPTGEEIRKYSPEWKQVRFEAKETIYASKDSIIHETEGLTNPIIRDLEAHADHLKYYQEIPQIAKLLEKHPEGIGLNPKEYQLAAKYIYEHDFGKQDIRVRDADKVALAFADGRYKIGTVDGSRVEDHLYVEGRVPKTGIAEELKTAPKAGEEAMPAGGRKPFLTEIEAKGARGQTVHLERAEGTAGPLTTKEGKQFFLNPDDAKVRGGGMRAYDAEGHFLGVYAGKSPSGITEIAPPRAVDKDVAAYRDLTVAHRAPAPAPETSPISEAKSVEAAVAEAKTTAIQKPLAKELPAAAKIDLTQPAFKPAPTPAVEGLTIPAAEAVPWEQLKDSAALVDRIQDTTIVGPESDTLKKSVMEMVIERPQALSKATPEEQLLGIYPVKSVPGRSLAWPEGSHAVKYFGPERDTYFLIDEDKIFFPKAEGKGFWVQDLESNEVYPANINLVDGKPEIVRS